MKKRKKPGVERIVLMKGDFIRVSWSTRNEKTDDVLGGCVIYPEWVSNGTLVLEVKAGCPARGGKS